MLEWKASSSQRDERVMPDHALNTSFCEIEVSSTVANMGALAYFLSCHALVARRLMSTATTSVLFVLASVYFLGSGSAVEDLIRSMANEDDTSCNGATAISFL